MRSTLLVALLAGLAACRGGRGAPAHGPGPTTARGDTVAILEAVWRVAAAGHLRHRAAWLYLPDADTAALTASGGVRAALVGRGVPTSARPSAGDDTVVFRVHRWAADSGGAPLIELRSWWTTVLASGRCRSGSGSEESFRARRTPTARWSAERVGPVLHGTAACVPLQKMVAPP